MDKLQRAISRIDHGINIANESFDDAAVEDLKECRMALMQKDTLLQTITNAKNEYESMPGIGKTIVNILNDIESKVVNALGK